ncbi:MAG TPA: mechanosensitive ion channel family protein [Mycobacteriales bacterium]|nr:mechanosensitive ion channel family protein [Mycobacteriales bacterium]
MSTDNAQPACAQNDGSICHSVWNATHNSWLAKVTDLVASHGGRIVLIIVVALIFRYVAHRTIRRLTRVTVEGEIPSALKPLKEKAAGRLREGSMLLSERRRQRAATVGSVLRSAASMITFTVAFILVLGELGIDLGPIIAGAGIAGFALGFGAQNLVKDFLAGMFMILEDQYGVGDLIDVGQATGTVEAVGLRATVLRDEAGAVWYVRNGEIIRVGNMSQGTAVLLIDIPVPAGGDLQRAGDAMLAAARELVQTDTWTPLVSGEPELLGIQSLTADSTVLRMSVRTKAGTQQRLRREVYAAIRDRFAAASIPLNEVG